MFKIFRGKEIGLEIDAIEKRELFDKTREDQVARIIEDVKMVGDEALISYAEKFDNIKLSVDQLKVSEDEIKKAYKHVDKDFIESIQTLEKNITDFHSREKESEWFEQIPQDAVMGMRNIPIDSVGIYVPGGRAVYPSSVLMNAIPAKVAGVKRIAMASPPEINPHVLVAAAELQITEVYKVGGVQAIAALAYGTQTIKKVDKIVGPGNAYVALAKKQVAFKVGIDSIAGPSDIVIVADYNSEPQYVAADLLSQCEHDPDAQAILITDSEEVAKEALKQIEAQIKKLKRREIIEQSIEKGGRIFIIEKMSQAPDIINRIAPEHLELLISPPQKFLEKIRNAGAVFMGPYTPVALGDYGAGPNHVLPTSGTARFSSPLGVWDFIKRQSFLGYTKGALAAIKKDIVRVAETEGLDAHKRSIEIRFS